MKQFTAIHSEDLQRSPPCKRQTRKAKCEKKLWNAKTMKIDGKKMLISYMKFRMHDSLLRQSPEVKVGGEIGLHVEKLCTCRDGNQVQFQTKRRQKKIIRSLQLDSESRNLARFL